MPDWPSVLLPPFTVVSPFSEESSASQLHNVSINAPASGTVTQNQAYFFPFRLDVGRTAVKMFAMNGATANGNTDVGIYDDQFNYLISSGATLQSGTNAIQEFDITDTYLPPGLYWMALSSSSATATFFRVAAATDEAALSNVAGYQQATAHPLPTSAATPVITTEAAPLIMFVFGVAFDTLI